MSDVWGSDHVEEGQIPTHHPDRVIARLAAAQHGVVARRQLLAAGLTPAMLDARMRNGRLLPFHRGVYAVGHARLRREGCWLAAVLAIGPEAVLSHRDAAALHDLRPANGTLIDITTAADRRGTPGIRIHRTRTLDARDVTTIEALPVTTVARTLVDLADVVRPDQLAKALSEAERQGKLDIHALDAALQRTRGRHGRGHARLKAALAEQAAHGPRLTRSELEDRFHALLDASSLPRPLANARIDGVEVDALWPAERVVVELDGYAFHRGRRAFERDREKANALAAEGYVVLRFTYDHVTRQPAQAADKLRRLLAARGASSPRALSRASESARPPRAAARRAS